MRLCQQLFTACVVVGLSSAAVQAGPCTTNKTTEMRDAGSGPTPGSTSPTGGSSSASPQHPPTDAMNQQAGSGATSSEDVRRQTQGQPTAAQQAEGAKGSSGQAGGKDC